MTTEFRLECWDMDSMRWKFVSSSSSAFEAANMVLEFLESRFVIEQEESDSRTSQQKIEDSECIIAKHQARLRDLMNDEHENCAPAFDLHLHTDLNDPAVKDQIAREEGLGGSEATSSRRPRPPADPDWTESESDDLK